MTLKGKALTAFGTLVLLAIVALAGVIALGGPATLPPMKSIQDPFGAVDFSDLAPVQRFAARDGTSLAYRAYVPKDTPPAGSVVLVHGSSARSNSMHAVAKAFMAAGIAAYALDIRGHGDSGRKGTIAYIGQLEDDLEDFMKAVEPRQPSTLVGFSSGGGFALRFAGSARQHLFQSCLLMSPFIGLEAPNERPDAGGWVSVGVPRIVGLALLNRLGIHWFNDLPITRFALSAEDQAFLTPSYSFSLAGNFQPQHDWRQNIRDVTLPCAVIAGVDDEVFHTDKLEAMIRNAGKSWPVTLIPGVGHMALTIDPKALAASVVAVRELQAESR